MEIKDAIISTLAEIDKIVQNNEKPEVKQSVVQPKKQVQKVASSKSKPKTVRQPIQKSQPKISISTKVDEMEYLKSIRERMLVLFEGLQSPQNKNIEDKLELTLNFLEYSLATIQERLDSTS